MISSLQTVALLLLINAVIALAYLIAQMISGAGTRAWLGALVMLLCPIIGPVFIGGSAFIYRVFLKRQQVDLSEVSFSHEKKEFLFAPEAEESELVPIEESLLVATHAERRRAFLKSIRLNVDRNVSLYSMALENDDSETSHYSASIVMEAASDFQATLQGYSVDYAKRPGDAALCLAYLSATHDYLESGLLTGIERKRYDGLYVHLADELRQAHAHLLTPQIYAQTVSVLLNMQNPIHAETWAKAALARHPDEESAHLSLLKVYYEMGNAPAFMEALQNLQNSYIELSRTGAQLLRFFAEQAQAANA